MERSRAGVSLFRWPGECLKEKLPSSEVPGYRLPLMAFLLRWWQSFLHTLSFSGGGQGDGWVEPGNEITRAILSGDVGALPALQLEAAEATQMADYDPRPAQADAPVSADVADEALDAPAAEEQREAPATRTRKKRGRRAA